MKKKLGFVLFLIIFLNHVLAISTENSINISSALSAKMPNGTDHQYAAIVQNTQTCTGGTPCVINSWRITFYEHSNCTSELADNTLDPGSSNMPFWVGKTVYFDAHSAWLLFDEIGIIDPAIVECIEFTFEDSHTHQEFVRTSDQIPPKFPVSCDDFDRTCVYAGSTPEQVQPHDI